MTSMRSLDAYRSHELSMQMRTSSGDMLSLNFENTQSLSLSSKQDDTSKETQFSFSSMQAFSFKLDSNGISEQDQKEIDAFMKNAQPYIDKFMKELSEGEQKSPINKIASDITRALGDLKHKDDQVKNHAKHNLVDIIDQHINTIKSTEKMIEEAHKLLEKVIRGFDRLFEPIYA